jgi:hypothetical protein
MTDKRSLAKRTADLAIHLSNPDERATAHEAARFIAEHSPPENPALTDAQRFQSQRWPELTGPQSDEKPHD